ncbi:hypothetical protein ACJ72_08366 [Emergomyces africanus]|uniref:Protein YIP n=1 Tax=Emergomyces africanus TaxID=1955775 RepID=A0A1B7NKN2_9EURO|nr:hypothetical protein ACJ72_08366 [Emergomyces africanus]
MANRGYDVVVDVDAEGDLGHTDLQEDLEFHPSNFEENSRAAKPSHADPTPFLGSSSQGGGGGGGPPSSSRRRGTSPGGTPSKHRFWTLTYYSQFFDVDTSESSAAAPPRSTPAQTSSTSSTATQISTDPSGSPQPSSGDEHFVYDFRLLSGAAGLVYGYTGVIPIALWGALSWFGRASGGSGADLVECWALYGYANLVWIAVALVSWSPLTALNWVLVGVGFGWSVFFMLRNLYPVLSATDVKTSKVLLIAVIVLHAGLSIAIKILFFAHGSPVSDKNKGKDKDHDGDKKDDGKNDKMARMLSI